MEQSRSAVREVIEAGRGRLSQVPGNGQRIFIPGSDGQSGWALESWTVPRGQLEEMLKAPALPAETKLEIMRAIDAGEVQGGYPGAYECAAAHLEFVREHLPPFGQENDFSWIRRITGGGSGTLTGKRDANGGIRTDMSEAEYDAAEEISRGFYNTAEQLNERLPRRQPLTLYRGFTIAAPDGTGADDPLVQKIAGFSDVLPSSASWQRAESIKMSAPRQGENAVLIYMTIPPDHPIVAMSYPDNQQKAGRPIALDLQQAEVLVAASTYEDVKVLHEEPLSGGQLRYHVSVKLAARGRGDVMQGIQTARATAQSSRKPKAESRDVEPSELENVFGSEMAGEIKSAAETGGTYVDRDGKRWVLEISDDMFGYTFSAA